MQLLLEYYSNTFLMWILIFGLLYYTRPRSSDKRMQWLSPSARFKGRQIHTFPQNHKYNLQASSTTFVSILELVDISSIFLRYIYYYVLILFLQYAGYCFDVVLPTTSKADRKPDCFHRIEWTQISSPRLINIYLPKRLIRYLPK